MHMESLYQDYPDIHVIELENLSPMSWHDDQRWFWRDLPKIQDHGLWYPLLYYKVTLEWWNNKFASWKGAYESWDKINPPVVNEDDKIWALKMGTNRLTALKFLGYNTCDAICFENSDDLIKTGVYFREEDPLHNE